MEEYRQHTQPLLSRKEFLAMLGSMAAAAAVTYVASPHETIQSVAAETADTNNAYGGTGN